MFFNLDRDLPKQFSKGPVVIISMSTFSYLLIIVKTEKSVLKNSIQKKLFKEKSVKGRKPMIRHWNI